MSSWNMHNILLMRNLIKRIQVGAEAEEKHQQTLYDLKVGSYDV